MNKEKLKKELVKISELEDNWDGYGAKAFTKEIIDKVNTVIDCLDDKFPDPYIVPSPIGIQFEWDISVSKFNTLEISIDGVSGDEISSFQVIGKDMENWIDKKISDLSEINELLEEFYNGS